MSKIKSIVIDDEDGVRKLVIGLVNELNPAFDVVGNAGDIKSGFELIQKAAPHVVFLDIRMPGGGGFELLRMFDKINFEVVFISGFDSYALKAFEFNALDYVLKPIDPLRFAKTLEKVQMNIEKKSLHNMDINTMLQSYDETRKVIAKIPVHAHNKVWLVPIDDILFLKWEDGYTIIKVKSGEKYTTSKQLGDMEFILEQHPSLTRISKSAYINLNHIKSYSKGVTCSITMSDDSEFEVPRRKKGEILELLSKNGIKP
jgi:two-component system LytT family response regulator